MSTVTAEKIYNQYKPFLYKLSQRYVRTGVDLDDVMQMAYFGLHAAVETYDVNKGASFTHYLAVCVRRAIIREMEATGSLVRIPSWRQSRIRRSKQVKNKLTAGLMREPYRWELARAMGMTVPELMMIEQSELSSCVVSLDAPINDEDDITLIDMLRGGDDGGMIEDTELMDLRRVLWQAVGDALTPVEYDIIHGLYALRSTLGALAKFLGVSLGYISQIKVRALRKLRRNRIIRRIGEDYFHFGIYRHVGVREYNRTWTSSTEAEVLRREEWNACILSRMRDTGNS